MLGGGGEVRKFVGEEERCTGRNWEREFRDEMKRHVPEMYLFN
jgi:hypothetical protein